MKMKTHWFRLTTVLILFVVSSSPINCTQADVDYIAAFLDIDYEVIDNYQNTSGGFIAELTLTNTGPSAIATSGWQIYVSSFSILGSTSIQPNGTELGNSRLISYHVQGSLHRIEPMTGFLGIAPGASLVVRYTSSGTQVARTSSLPNFYVTSSTSDPRIITSTSDRDLTYVAPFLTPFQYKRAARDTYNPPTNEERFLSYPPERETKPVVPTPLMHSLNDSYRLNVHTGDWVVVEQDARVHQEALLLALSLDLPLVTTVPSGRYILLSLNEPSDKKSPPVSRRLVVEDESYNVEIIATPFPNIRVTANTTAGVFWGTQTILDLDSDSRGIPLGSISDQPRFSYRGVHVDVCRNFHPKPVILKLIDVMAMYKLNKLHFHLADDEGWRLEIPGIPELTQVGSKRCHDLTHDLCIMPQLGSSPVVSLPGSGYYTVADYQEILSYANQRHITVIPEFDMPGHSHAAINAMEARYRRYMAVNDPVGANQYRLIDPNDQSEYLSVQTYTDNAINPCVESTYSFITQVVKDVKAMHSGIQELTVYHFGGDETASGAWVDSPACQVFNMSHDDLMEMFVKRVAQLVQMENLSLGGWEDGLLGSDSYPYKRSNIQNDEVIAYSWNNVWEYGNGNEAYRLANEDYKVVLSHATHLYFDHPVEPDPEERGLLWATRFTNTSKAFGYIPDDVYANMDVTGYGYPLDRNTVCAQMDCTPLNESLRSNVIGIQSQLWTETVRYEDEFFEMKLPRLVALAERAWHKASWENDITDPANVQLRQADWESFASTLGRREFYRFDQLGVTYHLPVPGARITGTTLLANVAYPGLPIRYSLDNGVTWNDYKLEGISVSSGQQVVLISTSADGRRQSRQTAITAL